MPDNVMPMAAGKFGLGSILGGIQKGLGTLGNLALPGDPFPGYKLPFLPGGGEPANLFPVEPSSFWPSWGDDETEEATAVNGINGNGATNIHGCQIYVPLETQSRLRAPKGYVVVTRTNQDGSKQRVGMLKEAAIKCGLWKRPRKPPITASQYKTLRTANSVIKKVDRVVAMTNEIQGKNKLTRSRSGRC